MILVLGVLSILYLSKNYGKIVPVSMVFTIISCLGIIILTFVPEQSHDTVSLIMSLMGSELIIKISRKL